MPQPFFTGVLRTVAALPEAQRRDYVRVLLALKIDSETENLVIQALPAQSAAACRAFLTHLREWS